jgi:hypothetical protein
MQSVHRNSPSRCELFALYDGCGISIRQHQAASFAGLHMSPCQSDNDTGMVSIQNSPLLSIRDEDEGYNTPCPHSDSRGASASPEQHAICHGMHTANIDITPRAPTIRPLIAPLHDFDTNCDPNPCNLSRSKLDDTFSHLRLCFNYDTNSIQAAVSTPEQTPTAASAQTTPQKNSEKNGCLVQ